MDSIKFALNSVCPIILTVVAGYLLKRLGMIDGDFIKMGNKLVFRAFLPITLFMNVYGIESPQMLDFGYVLYALAVLLVIFAAAIPTVIVLTKKKRCRGALLQGIFRSNYALIGIPLAQELFGEQGTAMATLLSAFIVPTFNILAVIGLSIFNNEGKKPDFKKILLGIIKNPLIIGIAAGAVALLFRKILADFNIAFRVSSDLDFIWGGLKNLSGLSTPLALVVLGAQFEFSAIKALKKEIISGVLLRSVIVPIVGIGGAYLLFRNSFGGAQFAALVAAFGTPVAVSSVPMAQEMGADTELAGQLVVFTTITSALTVFVTSALLYKAGIFC